MKLIKFTDSIAAQIVQASIRLSQANKTANAAKKEQDAAKEAIRAILKEHREIDLAALPIGEAVSIQCEGNDTLLIQIGSTERLDLEAFRTAHPLINQEFTKAFPKISYTMNLVALSGIKSKIDKLIKETESHSIAAEMNNA